MNNFFKQIVIRYILRPKHKKRMSYSAYELAKGMKQLQRDMLRGVKNFFLIILGISSAAFGLEGFLLPNSFIDGGATGISLLITKLTGISLSILLVAVNLPFVLLGYKVIGKQFAVKTLLAI